VIKLFLKSRGSVIWITPEAKFPGHNRYITNKQEANIMTTYQIDALTEQLGAVYLELDVLEERLVELKAQADALEAMIDSTEEPIEYDYM
jgi:hypothetical protein